MKKGDFRRNFFSFILRSCVIILVRYFINFASAFLEKRIVPLMEMNIIILTEIIVLNNLYIKTSICFLLLSSQGKERTRMQIANYQNESFMDNLMP